MSTSIKITDANSIIHGATLVAGKGSLRDRCIEFINNDDIKKYVRETFKPIINIIYNEIYLYIWFISLYNVFLLFITLANLFILQKMLKKMNSVA